MDNKYYNCSGLTSITIGKGVTSIGQNAFRDCKNVKEITCTAVTPPECKYDALATISRTDSTLYVPETSISDYKNTAPWSEFFNIKGIGESTDVISPNTKRGVVVSAQNGNIVISGTVSGETVSVYNVAGSMVKNVKATSDNIVINGLADNSVYVVKIGGSSVKIAM